VLLTRRCVAGVYCTHEHTLKQIAVKEVLLTDQKAETRRAARAEVQSGVITTSRLPSRVLNFIGFVEAPGQSLHVIYEAPRLTLLEVLNSFDGGKLPVAEWVRAGSSVRVAASLGPGERRRA
jgi:hypothetical protein